ncbi:hypothetical protein RTBOTA2_000733 [Rhodotorula toruloides]|uniref:Uncharacterized protein n=1 Tax=Rhodotorula toruloides TaxID=5286 RepID=A0A0K3CK26_RHOTO|nr:hypothetical protein RTBOTA2_000733 [Rhodotorula toruloides]
MPSLRACLASLALVALAFAPINASTASPAGLVARGQHAQRAVKSSAAVARRQAAAKALKKRARAGRTTIGHRKGAKGGGGGAGPVSLTNPYSPDSPFLNTKAALAAAKIRCGSNAICRSKGPAPPADANSFCINGSCTFRCNAGFAPGGADGTQCVPSSTTCGANTCTVPQFGYATCNVDGTCNIGCAAGYTRFSQNADGSGPYACFAVGDDPANCGTPNNVCPPSYNGIGKSVCRNGTCRIHCPYGYALRRAKSAGSPFYCYNGPASLRPGV